MYYISYRLPTISFFTASRAEAEVPMIFSSGTLIIMLIDCYLHNFYYAKQPAAYENL